MNLSSLGDEVIARSDHLILQRNYLIALTVIADLVEEYFHCNESFDDRAPDTYSHRNKSCEEAAIALLVAEGIAVPVAAEGFPNVAFTLDTTGLARKLNQVEGDIKAHQRVHPTPEQQQLMELAIACSMPEPTKENPPT